MTVPLSFQRSPLESPAELVGMPLMLMTPEALTVMRIAGVVVALVLMVTVPPAVLPLPPRRSSEAPVPVVTSWALIV